MKMGLMQLIPETAERFNVKNATTTYKHQRRGCDSCGGCCLIFRGDVQVWPWLRNSGEGTVDRYGGVPPLKPSGM
jgi:hypothetical protein